MSALNLQYLHSAAMGYGRMGTYLAAELERMGVTVYDRLPTPEELTNPFHAFVDRHLSGSKAGRAQVVCWVTVPPHARGWWKGQVSTIYTMWEGGRLPEGFLDTLHHFDTVIVPSQQNLELFSEHHHNVHYSPLGIDPATWHPQERTPPGREFRFLHGGAGERKGVDLSVKAFRKVFGREGSWGSGPVPTLICKSPAGAHQYGNRIQMITGRLSDEDEVALYGSAHCYLGPSRGEGFGLQPLQAIAQGCPTILTNAHGHASYAHLGIPLSSTRVPSGYFIYGSAGEWWEPSFDELCDAMWDVYHHWDTHAARAKNAAAEAVQEFTWSNSALGLLNAIGPERLGEYHGVEEWFAPDAKLYKIVTRKDWATEIAGANLYFRAGQEYYELSDVKRIMFEAGLLDPSCLDDGGLTPEQVERSAKYRAILETCPTCHRPGACPHCGGNVIGSPKATLHRVDL